MSVSLEESYAYCRRLARRRARNFYYSFLLLDAERRAAMCALYAFNRVCDDISDEPARYGYESPARAIADWERQLDAALARGCDAHPIWPAFRDTVRRYRIPPAYFHDMIEGVRSDLEPRRFETFDELRRYCYRVASAVGLSILYVFGFASAEALPLAEKCGLAFQLTNILRDVREDARMGRVYLPAEDLRRFGVDPAVLRDGGADEAFRRLMRFEAARARRYYEESGPLVDLVAPPSRAAFWALVEIYRRLLARIEASDYDVLSRRVRVPAWEKGWIVVRGVARKLRRG